MCIPVEELSNLYQLYVWGVTASKYTYAIQFPSICSYDIVIIGKLERRQIISTVLKRIRPLTLHAPAIPHHRDKKGSSGACTINYYKIHRTWMRLFSFLFLFPFFFPCSRQFNQVLRLWILWYKTFRDPETHVILQCSKELTDSVVRTKSPKLANLRSTQSAPPPPSRAHLSLAPVVWGYYMIINLYFSLLCQLGSNAHSHNWFAHRQVRKKKKEKKTKMHTEKGEYDWVFAGGRGQQAR